MLSILVSSYCLYETSSLVIFLNTLVFNLSFIYFFKQKKLFLIRFLFLFTWLGLSFKYVAQIITQISNYQDYLDQINFISLISIFFLFSIYFADYALNKIDITRIQQKLQAKFKYNKVNIFLNFKMLNIFLILTYSLAIFLNFKYMIYVRGIQANNIYPQIYFIFTLIIVYLLPFLFSIQIFRKKEEIMTPKGVGIFILYAFFEMLISISTLSRGFIFNSGSIIFPLILISKKYLIKIFLISILGLMFLISLNQVTKIRSEIFPILTSDESTKPDNSLISTVITRWVGINEILLVHNQTKKTNRGYVIESINYDDKKNSRSFFDTTFNKNVYDIKNENFKFITVPGLYAYSMYFNNYLLAFTFSFLMIVFFGIFEKFISFNSITSAFIGQFLAMRLMHFGFDPLGTFKFTIVICLITLLTFVLAENEHSK